MTNVLRCAEMGDKPISVRLDAEAQRALQRLIERGASQSQVIRQALIAADKTSLLDEVRADAERVGSDPGDRALMAEIREYMDELAPPG